MALVQVQDSSYVSDGRTTAKVETQSESTLSSARNQAN